MGWPDARREEADRIVGQVNDWLEFKGADTSKTSGAFRPMDEGSGTFEIRRADDGDRSWWMIRLDEVTPDQRRVRTALSVTTSERVSVYTTLEAGTDAMLVRPETVDLRCPRVIRQLLTQTGKWYHGASQIRNLEKTVGLEEGEGLAEQIKWPERAIPIVVVSLEAGATIVPELDVKLADDLAGIANVVTEAGIELNDDIEGGALPEPRPPGNGDVRFYKKKYSKHAHDIMEPVSDCGCNNWQTAHSADTAKRGIARLEERDDWKALHHCASCTGGGMWSVRW